MAGRIEPHSRNHVHQDLREALFAIAGEGNNDINGRKLGKWLSKNEKRVINGHKIMQSEGTFSVARWFLAEVKVESVLSV